MRTVSLIIILFLSGIQFLLSQEKTIESKEPEYVFRSPEQLRDRSHPKRNLKFEIASEGENYVQVNKFLDKNTGQRFNDIYDIWGIEYKGERYFHIHYTRDINKNKCFVKLDIIGEYCTFTVDTNIPAHFFALGEMNPEILGATLLGGALGALIYSSVASNPEGNYNPESKYKNFVWTDKNGSAKVIYIFDSKKYKRAYKLSRERLKKIFRNNADLHKRIDNNDLSYEEVRELIKERNQEFKKEL